MPFRKFPQELLRKKLSGLGIPAKMQDIRSLQEMLPVHVDKLPFNGADPDLVAEVLIFLIGKKIIHVPGNMESMLGLDWGAYACQFYHDEDDLLELLVPYFKKGLESNDYCVWVVSSPLTVNSARAALEHIFPELDRHRHRIEITAQDNYYFTGPTHMTPLESVLDRWMRTEQRARELGCTGLRVSGDTEWLEHKDWISFIQYEHEISGGLDDFRMQAICTCSLQPKSSAEVARALTDHPTVFAKQGKWWHRMATQNLREIDAVLNAIKR